MNSNFIAEVALPVLETSTPVLLTYGPMGIMLAWFMWRSERMFTAIGDLGHRIDGLTRAMLLDMSNRENAGFKTREYAREAVAKIDARMAKRKEP